MMSINILKYYSLLLGLSKPFYGDNVEYEIKLLKEIPFVAPVLAYWAYESWYLNSSIDFKAVASDYSRRDNTNSMPMTIVAVTKHNFPVGMISIKKTDLQSRLDITPWLSALYVHPEFRKNGIGGNLIKYLLNFCKDDGIRRLHLFIDKKNETYLLKFYVSRGWRMLTEAVDHEDARVKIYAYDIV
jgi:GNAT superfamily N-acetyltransferase